MKILHVDTGLEWRGGQQQVFYLNSELKKLGVENLLVCSTGGALAKKAALAGLRVMPMALSGEWDLISAAKISKLLKTEGFTHLHLHSSHAQAIGLSAAFMARFLNVVVTRRVDFVPKNHFLNRWKYGPGVARFIAISSVIEKILVNFGIPPERIRLVPSGVDPGKPKPGSGEAFRAELGIAPDRPLVGNIAALTGHKGQRYLVEAAPAVLKAHPGAVFVVAGDGDLKGELTGLRDSLGLGQRFIFTGFRKDVEAVMDALDIFVMPSHMEGLGTALIDAMAAGKPVVAARAGGMVDIVDDGVNGLLVEPKNPEHLAQSIIRLLSDKTLAENIAREGRKKFLKSFTSSAMAEGNHAVYRELEGF